jgi:hypothetical protein
MRDDLTARTPQQSRKMQANLNVDVFGFLPELKFDALPGRPDITESTRWPRIASRASLE